jgi:hypothetical protein
VGNADLFGYADGAYKGEGITKMMEWLTQHESLIAGFVGAIIGAAASILTVLIQSVYQAKRERINIVTTLALDDYRTKIELAKRTGGGGGIPPAVLFLHYYLEVAKLLEKGDISPSDIERLDRKNIEIGKAITKSNADYKAEKAATTHA